MFACWTGASRPNARSASVRKATGSTLSASYASTARARELIVANQFLRLRLASGRSRARVAPRHTLPQTDSFGSAIVTSERRESRRRGRMGSRKEGAKSLVKKFAPVLWSKSCREPFAGCDPSKKSVETDQVFHCVQCRSRFRCTGPCGCLAPGSTTAAGIRPP